MAVDVLGPMRVTVDGHERTLTGPRSQRLLARLIVAGGRSVPSWELRADVWPDCATSDSTLRVAVGRLRALLGDEGHVPKVLRHDSNGYLLDPAAVLLDAVTFEALVGEARRSTDDPERAVGRFEEALALWRGPPYDDLAYASAESERLTSIREAAVEERLAAAVAAGQGPAILAELEAAVADQPLREQRTASLMVALYRAGRQADALAAYRRLETTLRRSLGLSPSEELRQLEARVVSQDPSLLRPVATTTAVVSDQAAGRSRAAIVLAQRGVLDEAARLAGCAVTTARGSGDARLLSGCLIAQARVLAAGGRPAEALVASDEALSIARRHGDAGGVAAAAMVQFGFGMAGDDTLIVNLLEPLDQLPSDAPDRVEVLCAAMHQVAMTGDPTSALPLLGEASAIAERSGDLRARAVACIGEAVLAGIRREPAEVMCRLARIALAAAEDSGDPRLAVAAMHALMRERLGLGDVDAIACGLDEFDRAAVASLWPFALVRRGLLRTSVALARGELTGVQAQIERTMAEGVRYGVTSTAGSGMAQWVMVLLERFEIEEAASLLAAAPCGRLESATLALVLAEAGRADEAADHLRVALDPAGRAADPVVLAVLAAEAAWLAGWSDLEPLVAALEPLAGRCAVLSYGTLTVGPVDRAIGLLALVSGRTDDAVAAMRSAIGVAGSAHLWRARCQIGLAHALAVRGTGRDVAEASALLAEVDASGLTDPTTGGSTWLRVQRDRVAAALEGSQRAGACR